jgi:hypothetical protein
MNRLKINRKDELKRLAREKNRQEIRKKEPPRVINKINFAVPNRKFKPNHVSLDQFVETPTKIRKPKKAKPIRYISFGESIIADWLRKHNIKFIAEKQFKDLINPLTLQNLRMDFYLIDLRICIEFDGKQHFKKSKKFDANGKDSLKARQARDIIKNQYCYNRNIKMVRIRYNQISEIEKILSQHCLQPLIVQ